MKIKALFLALGALALSGCAVVSSPVGSALFTDVSAPVSATDATDSNKTGKSCASNVLGLVATGEASIEAAKRAGGVKTVSSVDGYSTNVLFLYARYCTVVKGQ